MQLSRCTLKKDGRKVILQGTIHGIPKTLLAWLKKDLKNHTRRGYQVFYEGIRFSEANEKRANYSEKELEVLKCEKLSKVIKEKAIKSMGIAMQFSRDERGIEYPNNAINIDISHVEYIRLLTKELVRKNIDCKQIASIFETILHEKSNVVVEVIEKLLNGETILNELHEKVMTVDYCQTIGSIGIDYRNKVAGKKIDSISKRKKINKSIVHYGENHIKGITDILINEYHWKLIKTVKIDSQNPTLRQKRF